jgi:hypothetical protein
MFQVSKWVMQAHFRHLSLNIFLMIQNTIQSNGFRPLQSPSENSGIHWDFNSQNGSLVGSVRVDSLTFFCNPGSMRCDSQASLLARNLASPCLGRKPKARVVTLNQQNPHTRTLGPQKPLQSTEKYQSTIQMSNNYL